MRFENNLAYIFDELGLYYKAQPLYEKALKKLGLNTTIENTQNVTLNGLKQACLGR